MNEAMKFENIKEFIKDTDTESIEDKNFIFGYMEPKFSRYLLFEDGEEEDLKNFLVFFTTDEIILVEVTHSGDFAGNIVHIERVDIKDFRYKNGIMTTKIVFKLDNVKFEIKTPQLVLTSKWQITNLKYLKDKNFFWN